MRDCDCFACLAAKAAGLVVDGKVRRGVYSSRVSSFGDTPSPFASHFSVSGSM